MPKSLKRWSKAKHKFDRWVLPTKICVIFAIAGFVIGIILPLYFGISSSSEYVSLAAKMDSIGACKPISMDSFSCSLSNMNLSRKEILSLIEKSQNEYSLFYDVGKAYIPLGNFSGAKKYFLKALENNIINIDIYSDIAWVSYQLNDFNNTIFYCGKYLQYVPQDTLCADLAALAAMRSGNLQLATNIYSQLIPDLKNRFIHALDDGAASAAGRGAYFKSINESDKALEFFKTAINYSITATELVPSACRFYNIAKFNEQIGENETAKEYYLKAAELDPNFNLSCPNICFPLV